MTRRHTLVAIPFALGAVAQAFGAEEEAPPSDTIPKIEAAGGQVLALAQNDDRLEVSFRGASDLEDEDLALLKDLPKITWLRLGGTPITDAGLEHIAGLTGLTKLNLEKTEITDAGLEHLSGLTNLTYLNIYDTAVTDAGLEHLKGLENLERLYVWKTGVTDEGVEALQAALPDLYIDRGWELPEPSEEGDDAAIDEEKDQRP